MMARMLSAIFGFVTVIEECATAVKIETMAVNQMIEQNLVLNPSNKFLLPKQN
jgi:hypothetical protein